MASIKEKLEQAAEQAETDGYEREDGKWVDPMPVQKVAIESGFSAASDDPDFSIWSVVNWDVAYREGNTVAENFERVFDQWEQTVEDERLKERVVELIEQQEQAEGDE